MLVAQVHEISHLQTETEPAVHSTNTRSGSESPTKAGIKTLDEVESAIAEAKSAGLTDNDDDSFVSISGLFPA
jgi:hypothetical protein